MQPGYFWCKLYDRRFLEKTFVDKKLFPERLFYEDSAFNTLTTIVASIMVKVEFTFYHYVQNKNSTVHRMESQLDKIEISYFLAEKAKELVEYRDIIYYKASILVGAALCYGCLPLYNRENLHIEVYLKSIRKLTRTLRKGQY